MIGEDAGMLDRYGASWEELIALVGARRTALADRDRRGAALEAEIAQVHALAARRDRGAPCYAPP